MSGAASSLNSCIAVIAWPPEMASASGADDGRKASNGSSWPASDEPGRPMSDLYRGKKGEASRPIIVAASSSSGVKNGLAGLQPAGGAGKQRRLPASPGVGNAACRVKASTISMKPCGARLIDVVLAGHR